MKTQPSLVISYLLHVYEIDKLHVYEIVQILAANSGPNGKVFHRNKIIFVVYWSGSMKLTTDKNCGDMGFRPNERENMYFVTRITYLSKIVN